MSTDTPASPGQVVSSRHASLNPTSPGLSAHFDLDREKSHASSISAAELKSPRSTRTFRQSTHLIPTPGVDQPRPKLYEPPLLKWWIVTPINLLMVVLAVALEIGIHFSNKNHGYQVRQDNVFKFASAQFLTSFFPTLLVAPLAILWEVSDWMIRRYQPYISLAKGRATAEDTILCDYIATNRFLSLWVALKHEHYMVLFSAITAIVTILMQPLAGAIFEIQQIPEPWGATATNLRTLGLDPERFELNSFLGSAGFVQAAVQNGLGDPPFIQGGWAAAEFSFPEDKFLNGTMSVDTVGIRTDPHCSVPANISVALSTVATPNDTFTIRATSGDLSTSQYTGCSVSVTFDPDSSSQQYGVAPVRGCGPLGNSGANATFLPVFFWYFHHNVKTNAPEAAGVFCQPTVQVFDITAIADLSSGNMTGVNNTNPSTKTIADQSQLPAAFNGVVFDIQFDNTSTVDQFIKARATATNSGVPGAIFRAILNQGADATQNAFNQHDGFLGMTKQVYTQHLSLIAKNTYFTPVQETLQSEMSALRNRLVIDPTAGHGLATILFFVGVSGIIIHRYHRHARRPLFLAAPPGSIGSIVSLTSRSGFGELLVPYDTEDSITRKLTGLRFKLDERTGAIIAYEVDGLGGGDDTDGEADNIPGGKADTSRRLLGQSGVTGLGYRVEPLKFPGETRENV